jgi:hypothetical protein
MDVFVHRKSAISSPFAMARDQGAVMFESAKSRALGSLSFDITLYNKAMVKDCNPNP